MSFRVVNTIDCNEIDGVQIKGLQSEKTQLKVINKYINSKLVILETPEGKKYTVDSDFLIRAIKNCIST